MLGEYKKMNQPLDIVLLTEIWKINYTERVIDRSTNSYIDRFIDIDRFVRVCMVVPTHIGY